MKANVPAGQWKKSEKVDGVGCTMGGGGYFGSKCVMMIHPRGTKESLYEDAVMNKMMSWLQEYLDYSNPIFGVLLILNLMVFPVYRASAAVAEPVQPMAQTAEQISDALDAVEVGVTPSQAFLEQPTPIRTWASTQKKVYEFIFNRNFAEEDAVYVLDSEITEGNEFSSVAGSTVLGDTFSVHFSLISEYQYHLDENISANDILELSAVDANFLVFIGKISGAFGSENIAGLVIQATRTDGSRNRSFLILNVIDQETIDNLLIVYQWSSMPELGNVPVVPQNCEQAFALADSAYNTAVELAKSNFERCAGTVGSAVVGGALGCIGVAIIAGALASPTGPGAIVAAVYGGLGCMSGIMGGAVALMMNCANDFNGDMRNAAINRNGARAAARAVFGEENCPDDPV